MLKVKATDKGKKKRAVVHRPAKHGILTFIQTGDFHPKQRKRIMLSKELERLRKLAIDQTPDMNIKKEMLINDAIFCQGIMDLAMLYINKAGLFEEQALKQGRLEMQSIIRDLGRFMNTKRQNLMAVGLGSKADEALDVQTYIKQFDEKEKKKEARSKK